MHDALEKKILSAALQNLFRTEQDAAYEPLLPHVADGPVRFAVCAVARHMGVNTEGMVLPADVAATMDDVTKMRRLISKAHMQVRLVSLPEQWHTKDCGVFLGCRGDDNNMVALLPQGSGGYILVDEDNRIGLPVSGEVAATIQRNAFMCYAGLPPRKLARSDIIAFMLRRSAKYDWTTIWFMSFVAGLLPLLLPLFVESIFRDIIPIGDRRALATITQVILVAGFTTAVVGFVRSISIFRVKSHVGIAFESAMWSRLLSLPAAFFRGYEAGNLAGRMQGVTRIMELLSDNALSSAFSLLFSFWSLVLMLYYSVKLTLAALAVWAVYLFITAFFYKKIVSVQRKWVEAANKTSARTLQLLNGLTKFRLHGGESSAFYLWSETFGGQWQWNLKARWYTNYASLLNVFMPTILSMLIFYLTMGLVEEAGSLAPAMDIPTFMGFQAAFSGFNAALLGFVPVMATLFASLPLIENIMPILETEPEATDEKTDAGKLSGKIEMKNLRFSYSQDSPEVLRGISISINAGECVAIVGPSGCGKSTLVRILLGFEKPAQGAVFFDGQDFSSLNAVSVRSQMGVVLQHGQIMAGDIFSNIVGSMPLTMDDAWEAARMVGLDADIRNMPMGMHTVISEGAGNISGGQKQRILLARGIVNRPKILILDEATSALDNATQAIVAQSVQQLRATRVIVAHRLSTIRDADRIYVLQDGTVAEEGTYEDLMNAGGFFAAMAQRQLYTR